MAAKAGLFNFHVTWLLMFPVQKHTYCNPSCHLDKLEGQSGEMSCRNTLKKRPMLVLAIFAKAMRFPMIRGKDQRELDDVVVLRGL